MATRPLSMFGAFIRLAFQPAKGAWNLIAGAGLGGTGALLWLYHHALVGGLLILGAIVLLLSVAGYRQQRTIEQAQQKQPKLTFFHWQTGDTHLRARTQYWVKATGQFVGEDYRMLPDKALQVLMLHVRNDPPGRLRDALASNAIVDLAFYHDDEATPFLEVPGQWTDNPQPVDRAPGEPVRDLRRCDLLANGEGHRIDVAIRYKDTLDMYAACSNFYKSGGREQKWLIADERCRVCVRIRAEGLAEDKVAWFWLEKSSEPDHDGNLMRLDVIPQSEWELPVTAAPHDKKLRG